MKRITPSSARKVARGGLSKGRGRAQSTSFVSVLARGERSPRAPAKASGGQPRLLARREDRRETREESDPVRGEAEKSSSEPARIGLDEFLYNPVLHPANVASPTPASAPQASALERAQAVALAERVLHSVQVGRIQGGHLVRLRLSSDVEIQLRHCDGVLQATVVGEGDQGALARRLDTELRARGLRFDRVELG